MTLKSGKLGSADVAAGGNGTVIYTCGAVGGSTAQAATATVSICNRGAAPVTVRLAVSAADIPVAAEYLEYDVVIKALGILERSGIAVSAGERIVVRSDIATVSARAHGFEK